MGYAALPQTLASFSTGYPADFGTRSRFETASSLSQSTSSAFEIIAWHTSTQAGHTCRN